MDQPEEVLEKLERFNVQKNPEITRELDEYVSFVARTGESVFNWALVKRLYREKLITVITEFNEASTKELPVYPNVDPFNYETMKKMLIERLDSFNAAPFTIQRISELLTDPRKQYSRIDKFMRAVEKNILVVSTVSPGRNRSEGSENGDSLDSVGLNGDFSSDVNVDIDMENENDGSFTMTKETNSTTHRKEENNEIVSMSQETVTVKKIGTKEEESSSAAVAVNVATGEPLQPTQTDVTIETQSSVTITVCEPSEDAEPSAASSEEIEQNKPVEASVEQKSNDGEEEGVLKAEPIVSEPKIDEDALLNEPLRPADDEILVDTSQTTPLAALENIVANRTVIEEASPRVDEQLQKSEQVAEQVGEVSEREEQKPEVVEEAESGEVTSMVDESGIAAKRLKLSEENSEADASCATEEEQQKEQEPKHEGVQITEKASEPIVEIKQEEEEVLTTAAITTTSVITPTVIEEPSEEQTQPSPKKEEEESVAPAAAEVDQEEAPEHIILPTQVEFIPTGDVSAIVEPSAVVEDIIEEQPATAEASVASQPEDEMEAAPSVENPMALDEDVVSAPSVEQSTEMDVTPLAANKMDTDNNETENALMDVDDDEPMDQ